jgi:hypothetical protein
MIARTLAFLALALAAAAPAVAQQQPAQPARPSQPGVTELGTFNTWRAISAQNQGNRQCYALGTPTRSEPRDIQPGTSRRNATNMFITFRPRQNVRNEISVIIGYDFRAGSNATIEVVASGGTRRFSLFTRGQGAWLQNAAEEAALIEALRRGREFRVRGTSQRGTNTTDIYSLEGISAALDRAAQECRG